MIQRIQTLFLLIAAVLSALVVFIPLSTMNIPDGDIVKLYSTGLKNINTGEILFRAYPILVLGIVTSLLSIITIFLYQNRILQMRLCVYNILLLLGLTGMFIYYYFYIRNSFDFRGHSFSITLIIPVVNIILIFQAFRAIRRDDLMVKSYERLR